MARCADWFTLTDLACDATSPVVSGMAEVATDWVFHATGSRWTGECQTRIHPTLSCGHADQCVCHTRWERLDMTRWIHGPVTAIDTITINGVDVADIPATARIDNQQYLVPITGGELFPWPGQDLNTANDGRGTWTVEVTHGSLPPSPVRNAAMELACQLARRASGQDCDLPSNATSVSDNGVTIQLDVPAGGRVGVPTIDTVLDLYGAHQPRRMFNPMAQQAPTVRL